MSEIRKIVEEWIKLKPNIRKVVEDWVDRKNMEVNV